MSDLAEKLAGLRTAAVVAAGPLQALAADILAATGMTVEDADLAAGILVEAQLHGIDSHGLAHLPVYVRRLLEHSILPNAIMQLSQTGPAASLLDANNGFGVLAAHKAMLEAIRLAQAQGIGACAVRNSSHFGAANYYVELAAKQGLIGIALSNAAPTMAPWGGREAILGTNPLAMAFPRGDGAAPIVIDMATSVVARGRIRKAAQAKAAIPADWALDQAGQPTTDADAALLGTIQPMGGAKGYALALAIELLCAGLSGGRPGFQVRNPHDPGPAPSGTSHNFLAIDPGCFAGRSAALLAIEAVAGRIESSLPAADTAPRLPGQRAAATYAQRRQHGIPVSPALLESITAAAGMVMRAKT